jgi:hypothetical protein
MQSGRKETTVSFLPRSAKVDDSVDSFTARTARDLAGCRANVHDVLRKPAMRSNLPGLPGMKTLPASFRESDGRS